MAQDLNSKAKELINQFSNECIACGQCVEVCPIVGDTELKDAMPEAVMEEIRDLHQNGRIGSLARTRIYSCLFCNTCMPSCPQGLNPGLTFGTSKGLLQELGDPQPKGVAGIMPLGAALLETTVSAFRKRLENQNQLITEFNNEKPKTVKTILFASCFGMIEGSALYKTLKILERIDPSVCVVGGYENCCGEFQFMGGKPDDAHQQFDKLIADLNSLKPERVVLFCPTCKMTFDHHQPYTDWSWSFITDFIAEYLEKLGPLQEINKAITVHDSCHFVRGVKSAMDSPRKILNSIPGVEIIEMKNKGDKALCCGAYAIMGTGKPGHEFRKRRLDQAKGTGADILSLYCPGCHMTLGSESRKLELQVESILSLLGQSLGIE